jgi:hypothetical protein
MVVEDELLFPVAARLLDSGELQRLGTAMQKRRGLSPQGVDGDRAE